MDNKLNIENISNGLLVLQKLKQLYKPESRLDGGENQTHVQPDRLSLLQETLTSISDFFPAGRGGAYSDAFKQGSRYSSAYREIKQHVRRMDGSRLDTVQFIKSLKLVAPILNNRQRVYMDKIVKIFDVLQS
ncbi:MAG: hypothetical protein ABFD25_15425 [Clostridiaceae bacterium]